MKVKSDTAARQLWAELPAENIISDALTTSRTLSVNNMSQQAYESKQQCKRQIFLKFSLRKSQPASMLALLDTGSDINIISQSYLELYYPHWKRNSDDVSQKTQIKSVTGQVIHPLGTLKLKLFIKQYKVKLHFLVMPDEFVNKCIIGRDIFTALRASLMYNSSTKQSNEQCGDHFYTLQPAEERPTINLLHLSYPGVFGIYADQVKLKQNSATKVYFYIKINPFIVPGMSCLVSAGPEDYSEDGIRWIDAKCDPHFMKNGTIRFFTVIINQSDRDIYIKHLVAHLEVLPSDAFYVQLLRDGSSLIDLANEARQMSTAPGQKDVESSFSETLQASRHLVADVNLGPNLKRTRHNQAIPSLNRCKAREASPFNTYHCCEIRVHNGERLTEKYMSPEELLNEEIMPSLSVPLKRLPTPEEVFEVPKQDEHLKPLLEDIFLKKYRNIIGTHNLDAGPVKYLGKIKLRVKPGMKLPKHTKMYSINESDQAHLNDILDFMVQYDILDETFQDDDGKPSAPWGSPMYLILRKPNPNIKENAGSPGFSRLICDFSQTLNPILEPTPALVKGIEPCLESIKGGFLFSLLDLKQSYYGLVLDPGSHSVTQCVAPPGRSFNWKRLPMGISSAPASLLEKVNQILNYVPKRDAEGKIIFQPGEDSSDPTARAVLSHIQFLD